MKKIIFSLTFFYLCIDQTLATDITEKEEKIVDFSKYKISRNRYIEKELEWFSIPNSCKFLVLKNVTDQKFKAAQKKLFSIISEGNIRRIEYSYSIKSRQFPKHFDSFIYHLSLNLLEDGKGNSIFLKVPEKQIIVKKMGYKEFNNFEPFKKIECELNLLLTTDSQHQYRMMINFYQKKNECLTSDYEKKENLTAMYDNIQQIIMENNNKRILKKSVQIITPNYISNPTPQQTLVNDRQPLSYEDAIRERALRNGFLIPVGVSPLEVESMVWNPENQDDSCDEEND